MHAIRQLGLQIPRGMSIIAYDDLPLADYLDLPLTTIAMPLIELGAAAVDAVVDRLQGHMPTDIHIPTSPRIVLRESTRRSNSA